MSQFIQLHLLTAYAPSNLNRDDQGRPKTAKMGGVERLRISSQSIKRAWRTSDLFKERLDQSMGIRTKRLGREIYGWLQQGGMNDKEAFDIAKKIAAKFGKPKNEKTPSNPLVNLDIEQLAHFSPQERQDIEALARRLAAENRAPEEDELKLLRKTSTSVDIALFGRMLANSPEFVIEAACQVAHPIGVSAATVEDDYFSAVDDLNKAADEQGAGHLGEQGFASALYYTYLCINRDQLLENLGGDEDLTQRTLAALTEAAVKVSPNGKQNSFASRAYADYVLVETGSQQPRSLATAFFKPVTGQDVLQTAIKRLEEQREKLDTVYGDCADHTMVISVPEKKGNFKALLQFVSSQTAK